MTGSLIRDKGAFAISELLKTNTSLNILNIGCLEEIGKEMERKDQTHMEMGMNRLRIWRRRKEITENCMG